jgi:hypothetical protein
MADGAHSRPSRPHIRIDESFSTMEALRSTYRLKRRALIMFEPAPSHIAANLRPSDVRLKPDGTSRSCSQGRRRHVHRRRGHLSGNAASRAGQTSATTDLLSGVPQPYSDRVRIRRISDLGDCSRREFQRRLGPNHRFCVAPDHRFQVQAIGVNDLIALHPISKLVRFHPAQKAALNTDRAQQRLPNLLPQGQRRISANLL